MTQASLNTVDLESETVIRHPHTGVLCEILARGLFETDATPAIVAREHNSTRVWVWDADGTGCPTSGLKPPKPKVVLTPGDRTIHVKSQGLYDVLYWATSVKPETAVVVYQSVEDGRIWLREHAYMFDGRFERVPIDATA